MGQHKNAEGHRRIGPRILVVPTHWNRPSERRGRHQQSSGWLGPMESGPANAISPTPASPLGSGRTIWRAYRSRRAPSWRSIGHLPPVLAGTSQYRSHLDRRSGDRSRIASREEKSSLKHAKTRHSWSQPRFRTGPGVMPISKSCKGNRRLHGTGSGKAISCGRPCKKPPAEAGGGTSLVETGGYRV